MVEQATNADSETDLLGKFTVIFSANICIEMLH